MAREIILLLKSTNLKDFRKKIKKMFRKKDQLCAKILTILNHAILKVYQIVQFILAYI